jgi:hypothetical protein
MASLHRKPNSRLSLFHRVYRTRKRTAYFTTSNDLSSARQGIEPFKRFKTFKWFKARSPRNFSAVRVTASFNMRSSQRDMASDVPRTAHQSHLRNTLR